MLDAHEFRAQLAEVLRQKNPAALRQFLVAQGQWPEDTTMDAERAMWTMILGNPALAALHQEANAWLIAHGHQGDAALLRGDQPRQEARKVPATGAKTTPRKPERKPGGAPGKKRASGTDTPA